MQSEVQLPRTGTWSKKAIKEANKVSDNLDQYYIGIEHVLMGVFTVSDYVLEYISLFGVDLESLKTNLEAFLSGDTTRKIQFDFPSINIDELGLDLLEKSTSSLSKFSVNLNQMALKDELPEILSFSTLQFLTCLHVVK